MAALRLAMPPTPNGKGSTRGVFEMSEGTKRRLASISAAGVCVCIRGYQVLIRPHLFGSCKFCPTCSEYALESFHRHGLVRGFRLAVRRLIRCHPFGIGGIDPVPPA